MKLIEETLTHLTCIIQRTTAKQKYEQMKTANE